MRIQNSYPAIFLLILFLWSCSGEQDSSKVALDELGRDAPEFSADNAYSFIENQLEFGPRVPGTAEHVAAKNWKRDVLREFSGGNVYGQEFSRTIYDRNLDMFNIIAVFNPTASDRILLAAHWDTRPRADQETDPRKKSQPIPGADDGGSGVGVLLELARIMSKNPPPIGVDIVLFDGEDYGRESDLDYYFLGAREWVNNPPVPGYSPRFGILLDMVGAEGATFPKERYSMFYLGGVVDQIWNIADELGYGHIFLDKEGASVLDDHLIVNEYSDIRMLNIIHHLPERQNIFPDYWHTHKDDIGIISKETLQAVGDVLVEVIYNRIK